MCLTAQRRAALIAIILALAVALTVSADTIQVTNPLVQQRADPWVYRHSDGYYYLTATVPEYDRIELRRATTLQGLGAAAATVVWRKHSTGAMGAHIWAPELHYIGGKWYIYFAAGRAEAIWDIRIYVLENASANPLQGSWVEKGQLRTGWESFALDATTFEHAGRRYLVWAQKDPAITGNSNLYIAAMSNPWTLSGAPVLIAKPDYAWEKVGYWVNEGPAVIKRNGRIFIAYSASATDANYALGLLSAADSSNLLSASSWSKSPTPVFQTHAAVSVYGPGHNSFTVSPDGSDDILIYHARNYRDITGDPLNDPNRHTRAQKLYWNGDGTPYFGLPVPAGATTIGGGANGTSYTLVNRNSGKCLEVAGLSSADGANVQQWSCNGGLNQRWRVEDLGGGYSRLINVQSGKALDVANCGAADGANVQQWSWLSNTCQQFRQVATDGGWVRIENRNSGKVLDVANCGTADGTNVRQWAWLSNTCQQWRLQP